MSTFVVPPFDRTPWPTLGPGVCDFIEAYWPHGPGDLKGEPARLDDETRALIYRAYEVYPRDHPQAGRRRFKRVALSLRKGVAKTEKAMWIAACELHPEAPVRTDGWRKVGRRWEPVGRGVRDPYIPLVAYTEEQTDELAFGALYAIISESPLADDFDIGLDRIIVLDERGRAAGRAVAVAGAPNARDGARTTFQHFDETHRFTLQRLKDAHKAMLANIPKRKAADAWTLETTTAYLPGEDSIAEQTWQYAESVNQGKVADSRLFFFHRQASDRHDLSTLEGARAAVTEASGPAAEWTDIDSVMALWEEPTTDLSYFARVWTNRPTQGVAQAFDIERWDKLAKPNLVVPEGALVTLGFDGARFRDATALVGVWVPQGHLFVLGIWERPFGPQGEDWEVPEDEVDELVDLAYDRWDVWRTYADPPYWESAVDRWAGRHGGATATSVPSATQRGVVAWWTNRNRQMSQAVQGFANAILAGDLSHDGNAVLRHHLGNARKRILPITDDQGERLWTVCKDRRDSPNCIDASVASILAWEARGHAIAAGLTEDSRPATARPAEAVDPRSVYARSGSSIYERQAARL